MIGKLKGIVDSVERDHAIIDVAGVGYKVHCSIRLLDHLLKNLGNKAELFIETIVREDQISLLGFSTKIEQECFNKLTTVQGVGNKLALVILAALIPEKISLAIASEDNKAFSSITGVGPKLSNRIIAELKDKHMEFAAEFVPTIVTDSSIQQDAIAALVNLGINKSEAYITVNKILAEKPDATISELIKFALRAKS